MLLRQCWRVHFAKPGVQDYAWRRAISVEPRRPPLKSWQEDAIQATLNAVANGVPRIGLHICGSDKISTLATIVDRMQPPNATATGLMLVAVSVKRAEKLTEMLSKQRGSAPELNVQIKSYTQILKSRAVQNYDESKFKAILLLEAHRARPEVFDIIAPTFNSDQDQSKGSLTPYVPVIIGSSSSEDVNALERTHFFKEIVYRRTVIDAVKDKDRWKCGARFVAVSAPIHISGLKVSVNKTQPFHKASGSKLMSQPLALQATIQAYLDNAVTRRTTLVYCIDDSHAQALLQGFSDANIDARSVTQFAAGYERPKDQKKLDYKATLAAFNEGAFPVLIAAYNLNLPIDLPSIDCVLIASLTFTRDALLQMILPGMKASPETQKQDTLVIQVVDHSKKYHGYDICDLLRLDVGQVDGQPLDVLQQRAMEKAQRDLEIGEIELPQEATPALTQAQMLQATLPIDVRVPPRLESVVLARKAPDEPPDTLDTFARDVFSKKRWIECSSGVFVNDWADHGHAIIRASPREGLWEAFWIPRRLDTGGSVVLGAERKLSVIGSLPDLLTKVSKFRGPWSVSREHRNSKKATAAQLAALRQFCPDTIKDLESEGKPLATDEFLEWLTVGDASNALARFRYGGDHIVEPFTFEEQTAILKRMSTNTTVTTPFYEGSSILTKSFSRSPG
ncbi:hypothetical protein B0H15DRAFT_179108 [Mycena belliarum]|uniref:Uncharacterized protein n=1 Tax=Mycena belliarum TaxID=1033014 RepID=A0AAD6UAL5_9AGAR|nr:hypothetical protein B0H15DRAFT_179108 [Mycena belliae]